MVIPWFSWGKTRKVVPAMTDYGCCEHEGLHQKWWCDRDHHFVFVPVAGYVECSGPCNDTCRTGRQVDLRAMLEGIRDAEHKFDMGVEFATRSCQSAVEILDVILKGTEDCRILKDSIELDERVSALLKGPEPLIGSIFRKWFRTRCGEGMSLCLGRVHVKIDADFVADRTRGRGDVYAAWRVRAVDCDGSCRPQRLELTPRQVELVAEAREQWQGNRA